MTNLDQVVEAWHSGAPAKETIQKLGISLNKYIKLVRLGRDADRIPPYRLHTNPYWMLISQLNEKGIRLGTVRETALSLTRPEQEWLLKQVPEDSTVSSILAAFVRDAYHEEVENVLPHRNVTIENTGECFSSTRRQAK